MTSQQIFLQAVMAAAIVEDIRQNSRYAAELVLSAHELFRQGKTTPADIEAHIAKRHGREIPVCPG